MRGCRLIKLYMRHPTLVCRCLQVFADVCWVRGCKKFSTKATGVARSR